MLKGWKMIFQANRNKKKTNIAMLDTRQNKLKARMGNKSQRRYLYDEMGQYIKKM